MAKELNEDSGFQVSSKTLIVIGFAMAQIIGMQNAGQNTSEEAQPNSQQPEAMGGLGGTPQAPQDIGVTGTGGGNIGIGNVPQSGEDQFSGTVAPPTRTG